MLFAIGNSSEIRIQTLALQAVYPLSACVIAAPLGINIRFLFTSICLTSLPKLDQKVTTKTSSQASKNMVLFLLLHICRVQRIHSGHDASFLIFSHSFLEEVGLPL